MHALMHRWDHFGESLGLRIGRALATLAAGLADWVIRHFPSAAAYASDDDILWDDGEPEERR